MDLLCKNSFSAWSYSQRLEDLDLSIVGPRVIFGLNSFIPYSSYLASSSAFYSLIFSRSSSIFFFSFTRRSMNSLRFSSRYGVFVFGRNGHYDLVKSRDNRFRLSRYLAAYSYNNVECDFVVSVEGEARWRLFSAIAGLNEQSSISFCAFDLRSAAFFCSALAPYSNSLSSGVWPLGRGLISVESLQTRGVCEFFVESIVLSI